jgi:hypothetical protein
VRVGCRLLMYTQLRLLIEKDDNRLQLVIAQMHHGLHKGRKGAYAKLSASKEKVVYTNGKAMFVSTR